MITRSLPPNCAYRSFCDGFYTGDRNCREYSGGNCLLFPDLARKEEAQEFWRQYHLIHQRQIILDEDVLRSIDLSDIRLVNILHSQQRGVSIEQGRVSTETNLVGTPCPADTFLDDGRLVDGVNK